MNRRPLHFVSREKEYDLIQRLLTIVNDSKFDPDTTAVLMVSPDYSGTIAMHLAHAWSKRGDMLPLIPVNVPYPDEDFTDYKDAFVKQREQLLPYDRIICVEAGIIRGGNWEWILNTLLYDFKYKREDITLVAMCENTNSKVKSDYVGEYYNDDDYELMFYFERYNKHWPIK